MLNGNITRLCGVVEKGWGNEYIFATNDHYCGKLLNFNENAKFSMHFHAIKDETWYVLDGKFKATLIETSNAYHVSYVLEKGDTLHIPPLVPHQLQCIEKGSIIEVSMPDSVEDNYRVAPGYSQREPIDHHCDFYPSEL